METKRLFALRAATSSANSPEDILNHVARLHDEILKANDIEENDIVSVMYTVTEDLDSMNPAAALRKSGRGSSLALFCAAEPRSIAAPQGIIRVLVHYYASQDHRPSFVYIDGAEFLRPDISAAQSVDD